MQKNIWIVTTGEPLPIDGDNVRLYRSGILARTLAERGNTVTWWTTRFDHFSKQHRVDEQSEVQVLENLRIRLLEGPGYARNISFARIRDHQTVADQFQKAAFHEPAPDLILCSLPTLELCRASTDYGKSGNVPVVLDVRDLWPDFLLTPFPELFHPVLRRILSPYYRMVRRSCQDATAIVGITDQFVQWGLQYGNRIKSDKDKTFYMGYSQVSPTKQELNKGFEFWASMNVEPDQEKITICFLGSFSKSFDFKTIIDAAKILEQRVPAARIVLCGEGETWSSTKEYARSTSNVIFSGHVGKSELHALMTMSDAALAPYMNHPNFSNNLTNKMIEYWSAGLPVLTSLQDGVLPELIDKHKVGELYLPNCHESLSGVVEKLYCNRDYLDSLALNAKQLYRKEFVAEMVYSNFSAYLENLT